MKKQPQKVAYLAEIPSFKKFFTYCLLTAQQPKWQNLCSKMWSLEQLYIELGLFALRLSIAANLYIPSAINTKKELLSLAIRTDMTDQLVVHLEISNLEEYNKLINNSSEFRMQIDSKYLKG